VTTRIVLCRHAETDETGRGRLCGALDVGLSAHGREQAVALAGALAALPVTALYTSPHRRAVETARPLAEALAVEAVELLALREIDFGSADGLTADELCVRHPAVYDTWVTTPTTVRFPGGESYEELRARCTAGLSDIVSRHEGGTVVAVSHAGVVRALLASCLQMPDEALFRIDQRYASVNVVDWHDDGTPIVRLLNGAGSDLP
jgi:alpha-ribazole phosphatase